MAPESPSSRPRAWHGNEPQSLPAARAASGRRRQIFVVLACMLALVGVIAGWLLFLSPFRPPAFLTVAITEYNASRFPVNAFAAADSQALLERLPGSDAHDHQTLALLTERLNTLRNAKDRAVVVHLCGFARTGEGGQLYLLPADAKPEDPETWLAMDKVLEPLRECPAAHKLLILDIHRSLDDPRLGTLAEDVGARFQELYRSQDQKGLLVLCACGPGQVSLLSEDLGHSVFGYYLDEGLRGYADGYNAEGKRDGRVSVRELAAFVAARVDRWALRNRGVRQTPVLLGQPGDFDLVSLKRGKPAHANPSPPSDKYPPQLRRGWQTRDRWLSDGTYLKAPHLIHQLEVLLLRQEQRARGGDAPRLVGQAINARLGEFRQEIEGIRFPRPEKIYSLSWLSAQEHLRANTKVGQFLRSKLPALKPDSKPDVLVKFRKDFTKKFKKVSDPPLSWTVFLLASDEESPCTEPVHFQALADLLRDRQDTPRYLETLSLYRLGDPKAPRRPMETVHRLLRVVRLGEQADACDPRLFPWVRHLLQEASLQRSKGEDLFFEGDPDTLGDVNTALEQAEKKYREAIDSLAVLARAYALRDEGLRLLPSYLPYLVAPFDLARRDSAHRTWREAVKQLKRLDGLLANPPRAGSVPEDFDGDVTALRRTANDLGQRLTRDLRRPLERGDVRQLLRGDAGDEDAAVRQMILALHEIATILLTPWPTARERQALWKDRRLIARELNRRTRELDEADDRAERPTRPPDVPAGQGGGKGRTARALERVKLSVALLELAGLSREEMDRLKKEVARAESPGAGPAVWNTLADALRRAWLVELPNQLRRLVKRSDFVGADRLTRLLHPVNWGAGAKSLGDNFNPPAELRRRQTEAYWKWLGQRYQERARALDKNPLARELYQRAAKDSLEAVP
jgi:hypothetical protein